MMKEMLVKATMRLNDLFEFMGYNQVVIADENEYAICNVNNGTKTYPLNGTETKDDFCNAVIDMVREVNGIHVADSEAYERLITENSNNFNGMNAYKRELEHWKEISKHLYESWGEENEKGAFEYVTEIYELSPDELEVLGVNSAQNEREQMIKYLNEKHNDAYGNNYISDETLDELIEKAKEMFGSTSWKANIFHDFFITNVYDDQELSEKLSEKIDREIDYDLKRIIEDNLDWERIDIDDMASVVIEDDYMIRDDLCFVF